MSTEFAILDNVRIASPCSAKWQAMTGDDRSRHCALCQKQVYNLVAMSAAEAVDLIREREGNLCVRLYRRADGTVITGDCPIGLRSVWRGTRRLVAAIAAAAVIGLAGSLLPGAVPGKSAAQPFAPPSPGPIMQRVYVVWDDLLVWMGIRQPPRPFVGDLCPTDLVPSGGPSEAASE